MFRKKLTIIERLLLVAFIGVVLAYMISGLN
jgi:hypothetical protein